MGTVSVTGLAYLDAVSKIDDKQDQIDDLNVLITQQDETIEKLSTTVSEVASEIGGITVKYQCLVLLQVPKYFVPVQIFWVSPKFWLHLVPLQKVLCRHKNQFYWMQIIFLCGTKFLWLAQYVDKFLVRHKKFGPEQNILGPVKGQSISAP